MLLHTWPTRFHSGSRDMWIPRHARIPLGLTRGSKLWATYRQRDIGYDQIMLSPYDPATWADLWRLEIQLDDRVGQLEEIVQALDSCRIRVLHLVSRNAFFANYHFKYLMLDCRDYVSDSDGSHETRTDPSSSLFGLRTLLFLKFAKTIRISSDGEPRIRVDRNLVHWSMRKAVDEGRMNSDEIHRPVEIEMKGNSIPLSLLPAMAQRPFDKSEPYATLSTNTKSHVIYAKIMNVDPSRVAHLVIHFDGGAAVLAQILAVIKGLALNIKRTQLKQGLVQQRALPDGTLAHPDYVDGWLHPYTLNIMVEAKDIFASAGIVDVVKKRMSAAFDGNQSHPLVYVRVRSPELPPKDDTA